VIKASLKIYQQDLGNILPIYFESLIFWTFVICHFLPIIILFSVFNYLYYY